MIFKFRQKGLFIIGGIICLISLILSPVGLLFFYMAARAKIETDDQNFIYTMLTKKVVPFADIKHVMLGKPANAYYKIGYTILNIATVVPLVIYYGDKKKIRISLNSFNDSQKILEILLQKTNLQLEEYKRSFLWG